MKALSIAGVVLLMLNAAPVVGAQQRDAQQTQALVTASEPEYVSERSAVRVFVSNHGTQPVTAWKVGINVIYADGVERGHSRAREGYPVLAGLSHAADRVIPAGGKVETWFALPRAKTTPIISLRSSLAWAVFADNTAIGDPSGVKDAFQERERDRKAWLAVATAVSEAAADANVADGLRKALASLNTPAQDDFDHPVKRIMRRNITMALQQPPDRYEEFVRYWLTLSRNYVREARRHSRPIASNEP